MDNGVLGSGGRMHLLDSLTCPINITEHRRKSIDIGIKITNHKK